jgi:hypothetical protein
MNSLRRDEVKIKLFDNKAAATGAKLALVTDIFMLW